MSETTMMQSWLFNYDEVRFEEYSQDQVLAQLRSHTLFGQTIILRDEDGALWLIESGRTTRWGEDEVLEVGPWRYRHHEFPLGPSIAQ